MRSHVNNIGFLRLVFASLVIVGHAPEMTDGNGVREPLHLLGSRALDLGFLSVVAFFLLSGYLITQSMERSSSVQAFVTRRALRIYPAFLMAFGLCVFILGPFVGVHPADAGLLGTASRLVFLKQPMIYPGQFPGLHGYNLLDGPMWTLWHEFQCYLVIALLGASGLLRPRVVAVLTGAALVAALAAPWASTVLVALQGHLVWSLLISSTVESSAPTAFLDLFAAFMVGSSFWMFRDRLAVLVEPAAAIILAVLAFASLVLPYDAERVVFILLASAPLFAVALRRYEAIGRINDRWDISYGTYLYGWPIATWVRWMDPTISPWVLVVTTLPLAWAMGAASWWGLERWCKMPFKAPRHGVPATG